MTGQKLSQKLDRIVKSYRIGDPDGRFPIYDARGSELYPGRWNTRRSPMIYTSEHYSTAMLEKLVRGGGMPPNQHYIEISIPNGVSYEVVNTAMLRGWDDLSRAVSRLYGETWLLSGRSAILFVPSIVARIETNILINPDHSDAAGITHSLHQPVWWDTRLYSQM